MRKFLVATALFGLSASLYCAPAFANTIDDEVISEPLRKLTGDTEKYRGFKGELSPVSGAVALNVMIGSELGYLADNQGPLGGARGLRNGFGTGGFLGEKDLMELRDEVEEELVERFEKRGVQIDPNASTVLQVVLMDAQPNRPTFQQLSVEPGLSYRSFGRGGASFEVDLIRAGGASAGAATYGFYSSFIDDARIGGTWSDANRAIDRFAKRVAKETR
jgi:hypothetical protein